MEACYTRKGQYDEIPNDPNASLLRQNIGLSSKKGDLKCFYRQLPDFQMEIFGSKVDIPNRIRTMEHAL
jgi:hypothetical protein